MGRWYIYLATFVWRCTPFLSIRKLYLRFFLFLVRDLKKVSTIAGIRYELDLGETIEAAIYLGQYEKDVSRALDHFCFEGAVVLDIGANIGAHTLPLAKKAGKSGAVHAFEPTGYAFTKLKRNVSLNPFNVSLYQVALSDRNEDSIEQELKSSWPTEGKGSKVSEVVRLKRLDDWCEENRVNGVHLIKLDVDGAEGEILKGAQGVLAGSHPVVVMEVGDYHFHDASKNPVLILQNLGYHFYDIKTGKPYSGVDDVRRMVPQADDNMTINIVAVAGSLSTKSVWDLRSPVIVDQKAGS